MATFEIDDKTVMARLDRVSAVAGGSPKAMRGVALAMKQAVYDAFRHQAGPDGTSWPALAAATLAGRRRRGNHATQPLLDTGDLYASIEAHSDETSASVRVGDGLPDARAWYNQMGTLTAPARPFLPIDEAGFTGAEEWLRRVTAPIDAALDEVTA